MVNIDEVPILLVIIIYLDLRINFPYISPGTSTSGPPSIPTTITIQSALRPQSVHPFQVPSYFPSHLERSQTFTLLMTQSPKHQPFHSAYISRISPTMPFSPFLRLPLSTSPNKQPNQLPSIQHTLKLISITNRSSSPTTRPSYVPPLNLTSYQPLDISIGVLPRCCKTRA